MPGEPSARSLSSTSSTAREGERFTVAGFRPTTLSDYPDRVAAIVFTPGCTFRCPFCHNPELVLPDRVASLSLLREDDIVQELCERRTFLDGVVITGGEPSLQPGLPRFAEQVKELGLRVKLDTNGSRPDVLARLLRDGLVDYVAMDVKAPPGAYARLAGVPCDLAAIEQTIDWIRRRAPEYEFRTTVAPTLARGDILRIAEWLHGARRYVLQPFRATPEKGLVDPSWEARDALTVVAIRQVWNEIKNRFPDGGVRA